MVDTHPESTISSTHVAELLSPTLGKEKSTQVVGAVVLKLALPAAESVARSGAHLAR